jgi:hypothetical protein
MNRVSINHRETFHDFLEGTATRLQLRVCNQTGASMRTFISLGFALLLAVVAGLLASDRPALAVSPIGPVLASPPSASAACFFQGFTCTGSGKCSCTPGSELYATVESISARETESGKEQLDCTGDIPATAPHPTQAVICQGPANGLCTLSGIATVGGVTVGDASLADGAVSGHPFVSTTDWMEVIAPSGQVTLHCRDLQPFGI